MEKWKLSTKQNCIIYLDINECLTNPCDANAQCVDTVGSFMCTCDTGFFGDGFNCAGTVLWHHRIIYDRYHTNI